MVSFHVSEELVVESSIFEILKIKTTFYITVQRNSIVCDGCGISSNITTQRFTNPQKQNRPNVKLEVEEHGSRVDERKKEVQDGFYQE